MRRHSEAVKAHVKRRMTPPQREGVTQNTVELGLADRHKSETRCKRRGLS